MDITEKIKKLKEEKNAVILAHYYAGPRCKRLLTTLGTPSI